MWSISQSEEVASSEFFFFFVIESTVMPTMSVVNEVRRKFNVPRLRVEIRLARKRCMWCRVNKSTLVYPKIEPLPAVRLQPDVRPFTIIGVDPFGPHLVKVDRSVAKRWLGLFTCLTVRAIHLEVVTSLSTDASK